MTERILNKEEILDNGYYDDILEILELCNLDPVIIEDDCETWRFKPNSIINYLLDYHQEETEKTHGTGKGLNLIYRNSIKEKYTLKEFAELYVHMGYSLSGFEEIFGDAMSKVLRISYDYETGEFIEKLGPTEETLELINKSFYESK
jgi:hypothetical protein